MIEIIGIYCIVNLINNKRYVGQSINIENRIRSHIKTSKQNNCNSINNPLYRAIRKHGIINFETEVLEECSVSELNGKEVFWIKELKTQDNKYGYNILKGGSGNPLIRKRNDENNKVSKEDIVNIIELLKTSTISKKDIGKMFNVSHTTINNIDYGLFRGLIIHINTFPIRKPKSPITPNLCIDCRIRISKSSIRCFNCNIDIRNSRLHYINRDEFKRKLRNESIASTARHYNVSSSTIKKWCIKFGVPSLKSDIKQYSDANWEIL